MALISCPECAAKISDSARKCPQCGAASKNANLAAVFSAIVILALFIAWIVRATFS